MTSAPKEKMDQSSEQRTVKDVAEEMTLHYRNTGAFRAEDVIRILGDPRTSVGIDVADDVPGSQRQHK